MKQRLTLVFLLFNWILYANSWQTDLDKALQIANEQHKTVIMVFKGSDWCGPCRMLDKKIWNTEVFKTYAKDHYVMVEVDFPRKSANQLSAAQTVANRTLAEQYNPSGNFPFVVILSAEKKVLGRTGYKKISPEKYIQHLDSFIPKN